MKFRNHLQIISYFLLLTMLFGCVSCANNDDEKKDDPQNTKSDSISSDTETEALFYVDDFGGEEFVILAPSNESYNFCSADFTEPSDDPYENAYYQRHLAIKEALNVEIKEVQGVLYGENTVYGLFTENVLANTGNYDMSVLNLVSACAAVGSGYLLPISELPDIDLSKSWWNEDCTEQLEIVGNNYMICGDIFISDKECIWILSFNKSIIAQHGLENPFELVYNNEWTWDKMIQMVNVASHDENGDGKMEKNVDVWGYETHEEHFAAMWESAGLKLVTINEEGLPEFSWGSSEFADVYEKIANFLNDEDHVKCELFDIWKSFIQGKSLFCNGVCADLRSAIANCDVDSGVIPNPKYSSDIEKYNSYVAINSCVVVFDNSTRDTYMSGVVAEAMAALGQQIVTPSYYDKQLKSRYAKCEDSAKMLDLIFNDRCYDLGVYYNWGSARTSLCTKGVSNTARMYAVLEKNMTSDMQKSFKKLGIYD